MDRDDLNDPLGMHLAREDPPLRSIPYSGIALAGCGVLALGLVGFTYASNNGMNGEPYATAAIVLPKKPDLPPVSLAAQPPSQQDTTASISVAKDIATADEVETQSGVRIIRRGGTPAPPSLIIQVPQALNAPLVGVDKRLTEKTKFGLLPRVAADGARPADVYARPLLANGLLKAGAPRIAIMVGGMGLAASSTQEAAEKLPGAVTLAFAPYGNDLDRQVAQARSQGHEVVLQAPMEPFDYPQNDPGPHTLRQGAEAAETLDDLHWLMGRFTGYAGVGNFLGARFTANPAALAPVLRDIAGRGLFFVDDGASPQSLVADTAKGVGLDVLKADVVIDANGRPDAIAASLAALESLARKNGSALGVASALPASVEQVNRFARSLESRGIALVPVSALAKGPPRPSAQRQ